MSESTAFDTSQKDFIVRPEERVVVFAAEWHDDIVEMLVNDAVNVLVEHGVRQVEVIRVPGCYELPQAVSMYFYGPLNRAIAGRIVLSALAVWCRATRRISRLFQMLLRMQLSKQRVQVFLFP